MKPARFVILTLLILIPDVINLSTPLYNRIEPQLLAHLMDEGKKEEQTLNR